MSDGIKKLVDALSSPLDLRTSEEISRIRSYLKSIESFKSYNDSTILEFASIARYECYRAKSTLFKPGDLCKSWYIILSGCVLLEQSLFLPRKNFGHRSLKNQCRDDVCIILEDTELIVFDYNDDSMVGTIRRPSQHNILSVREKSIPPTKGDTNPNRDSNCDGESDHYETLDDVFPSNVCRAYTSSESSSRRCSRVSESSSVYTSSDTKTNSSKENISSTSDDDSLYSDNRSVTNSFYSVINKAPKDRNETDIETMLDGIQYLTAFSSFSSKTKEALCRVMNVLGVHNANEKIVEDGFKFNTWNVILNGAIEIRSADGSNQRLFRGDILGVRQNMPKCVQVGEVWTLTPTCLFFSVKQFDFFDIINKNDDTLIPELENNGRVSLVYEERTTFSKNSTTGRVIVRGTIEKLCQSLIEEKNEADPAFVENFLLTYRIFMSSPKALARLLCQWYEHEPTNVDTPVKATIRRCLVLWANNHFSDIDNLETDMHTYLETFHKILSEGKYASGDRSLFLLACSNNAKLRIVNIEMARNCRENFPFELIGLQNGLGLFLKEVNRTKRTSDLRQGDQILKILNHPSDSLKSLSAAINIITSNHTGFLSMEVKYNPNGMERALTELSIVNPQEDKNENTVTSLAMNGSVHGLKKTDIGRSRLNQVITPMALPEISKSENGATRSAHNSPKREQMRQRSHSRCVPIIEKQFIHYDPPPVNVKFISNINLKSSSHNSPVDTCSKTFQVIKVFRPNIAEGKLIQLTDKTTAEAAISLVMEEYEMDRICIDDYALYLVSVNVRVAVPSIKCSRVAAYTIDLAGKLTLNQRYYIKDLKCDLPLITDEQAKSLSNESNVTFNQLTALEIATRLTFIDYTKFRAIEASEYINFIFELPPIKFKDEINNYPPNATKPTIEGFSVGCENYRNFEHLINRESNWPATEICSESNPNKRIDVIKKFINIARICKKLKNFNSMMSILIGLDMKCVSRLKSSWDKLPVKHQKRYAELKLFLNMDMNFRQIRQLEIEECTVTPMIPWVALHSKDLATLHMCNKTSTKEGLINVEKLRMIALEIRKLTTMCSTSYTLENILSSAKSSNVFLFSPIIQFESKSNREKEQDDVVPILTNISPNTNVKKTRSKSVDQFAFIETIRKKNVKRRSVSNASTPTRPPKKIYEEWYSTLKVRTYLLNHNVEMDSNRLYELSLAIEPSLIVGSNLGNLMTSEASVMSQSNEKITPFEVSNLSKSNPPSNTLLNQDSTSINSVFQSSLNPRPQSIFSYQDPEDADKLKSLVSVCKRMTAGRKKKMSFDDTISNQGFYDMFPTFQKSDNGNNDLSYSERLSENTNDLYKRQMTYKLKKPLTDELLQSPITSRAVRNHANDRSIDDNCYEVPVSEKLQVKTVRPRPTPTFTHNSSSLNSHFEIARTADSRPKPPVRKVPFSKP